MAGSVLRSVGLGANSNKMRARKRLRAFRTHLRKLGAAAKEVGQQNMLGSQGAEPADLIRVLRPTARTIDKID